MFLTTEHILFVQIPIKKYSSTEEFFNCPFALYPSTPTNNISGKQKVCRRGHRYPPCQYNAMPSTHAFPHYTAIAIVLPCLQSMLLRRIVRVTVDLFITTARCGHMEEIKPGLPAYHVSACDCISTKCEFVFYTHKCAHK